MCLDHLKSFDNDEDDKVRLYVCDELPSFTSVFSFIYLVVVDDDDDDDVADGTRIDTDLWPVGINHVTNIAIKASTEPNKNGGPGNKC